MDEEGIKRQVWEGRIPVCFTVAEEEVGHNFSDMAVPEPCYVSAAAYDATYCVFRVLGTLCVGGFLLE